MRPLSYARGCRGYSLLVHPTILSQEYSDGLASEECHVCKVLRVSWSKLTCLHRLTAIFLASKTTNHPIPLEQYASHIPNTTPSDVLDLEFLVAQSLSFEFVVWHAHRALWGIYLDTQVNFSLTFVGTL
jgi:hypothetical protein